MSVPKPHFLLFSETGQRNHQDEWRFVLQAADGSATFEAQETEPDQHGERLELLAVVRGLEALDQPSRVTLYTPSKYVSRGIAYGLEEWRANGWTWECYGQMVPVKNRDLWQRLDRALGFHRIEFRSCRLDPPHGVTIESCQPLETSEAIPVERRQRFAKADKSVSLKHTLKRWIRGLGERFEALGLWCAQLGTSLLPRPWLG
jgi:ribonuclease HI